MHAVLLLTSVLAAGLQPHTPLPAGLEAAALRQLHAAYGAYCIADQLTAWNCKWCKYIGVEKVYGVTTKVKYDGQAYVVRTNQSEIIVSFRGSHNIENWISDFTFKKTTLKWDGVPSNIEVHEGFLYSYEAMQTEINTWVKQAVADCPDCTLHVTGHSLGAAQALLCVTDLRLQGMKPELWNYGMPRVGGKPFVSWFDGMTQANNQTVLRMTNMRDVVPRLPPTEFYFHHVSREVWRSTNKTYIVCDGSGEDEDCSLSLPIYRDDAADHSLYMGVLEDCPAPKH
eukprot:TRINITY_DN614_c0_g1_i1.p1 TRINITY_DN614_c0_g1~~TRINITY_DN614_c0_g1_i1.p1  ORF type:complete len:293 (+),score=113.47 TRINITY_DN614_c0_g1_i1:29-880(+)